MAQRRSSSGRMPRNNPDIEEEEAENNGYVQVFVRPLERGSYSMILGWLGLSNVKLTRQQATVLYVLTGLSAAVLLYQILLGDLGYFFHRICNVLIPIFSVVGVFYCIALYLRKTWSNTGVYVVFCACFAGEFVGQCVRDVGDSYFVTQPLLCGVVLGTAGVVSVFSALETLQSSALLLSISIVRIVVCTTVVELPETLRPFVAYSCGVAGVIAAR